MDQWTNGPMDKKLLRPYEKKNTLEHLTLAFNQHLGTSITLILLKQLRVTLVTSIGSMN